MREVCTPRERRDGMPVDELPLPSTCPMLGHDEAGAHPECCPTFARTVDATGIRFYPDEEWWSLVADPAPWFAQPDAGRLWAAGWAGDGQDRTLEFTRPTLPPPGQVDSG